MPSAPSHTILVAGGDENIYKSIEHLFQEKKFNFIWSDNGESALKKIKNAGTAFSLIIADEALSGINGLQLLYKAKNITPDTSRFLMTATPKMETLIEAVNKVTIQKFIVMPFEPDDIIEIIQSGIERYDEFMETHRLLGLAKKQNTKLYDLTTELLKTTNKHNQTIHTLDYDIKTIKDEILELSSPNEDVKQRLFNEIQTHVKNGRELNLKKMETLLCDTIRVLYDQFSDLAYRSGFELPETGKETK